MSNRPETGTMQFGDDWPGVFIRGDDAFAFATAIRSVLNEFAVSQKAYCPFCDQDSADETRLDDPVRELLEELAALLDVSTKNVPVRNALRYYHECKKP